MYTRARTLYASIFESFLLNIYTAIRIPRVYVIILYIYRSRDDSAEFSRRNPTTAGGERFFTDVYIYICISLNIRRLNYRGAVVAAAAYCARTEK